MSSYRDASWLRRLWSLARPGDPVADFVQNVALFQDRTQASSREHAPYAEASGLLVAAGPGVRNFVEVRGQDALAPTVNFLHRLRWEETMANVLTGFVSWAIADGAALTTATRAAVAPLFGDADPDVSCELFVGTITTANLPASVSVLPRNNGIGQTNATPSFQTAYTEISPTRLPFASPWRGPNSMMFFGDENAMSIFHIAWQAMRS